MSASNTSASPSTIPASATPAILTTPNVLTVAARPTPIKPMPHATKSILVTTSVTFARDVAPILFERCLPCHRAGEIAPFRMDTYKQGRRMGQSNSRCRDNAPYAPLEGRFAR